MSIHVEIPEPLAGKVAEAARTLGKTPQDLVLDAVADRVDPLSHLNQSFAPVHERLRELGESEDDAVQFFEQIKHDLRRERRATGK
jgi:hypothetical protein